MNRNAAKNFLKPAPGRRVRDPITRKPMPAEGCDVGALTPYWHRRLRDQDVVYATPVSKTPSTKPGK